MATAWGPGVADRFWISAAAKGLELYCLESPIPDEAAARQMVAQAGPASGPEAVCVMCGQGPIRGGTDADSMCTLSSGATRPESVLTHPSPSPSPVVALCVCIRVRVRAFVL